MKATKKAVRVLAIAASITTAGALAVVATGSDSTAPDPRPTFAVERVSSAPEQSVLSGLRSLSEAPKPSSTDTADVQRLLDDRPGQSSKRGADLLPLVAEVANTAGRRSIVAAGPKFVCLETHVGGASSSGCTTHDVATNPNTPMVSVAHVDNGFLVSAVIPDAVSGAVVKMKDGTGAPLTMTHNFASAVVPEAPDHLVLTTTQGLKTTVDLSPVGAAPTLGK